MSGSEWGKADKLRYGFMAGGKAAHPARTLIAGPGLSIKFVGRWGSGKLSIAAEQPVLGEQ